MSTQFQYSRSSDSLDKIPNITTLNPISFKREKRVITNLSASRIDDLAKRVQEQDAIISYQNRRIQELERKMDKLMDILESKNEIWFHRDMLVTVGTDK